MSEIPAAPAAADEDKVAVNSFVVLLLFAMIYE